MAVEMRCPAMSRGMGTPGRGVPFTVTAVDQASGRFRTRDGLSAPMGMGYEYLDGEMSTDDVRRGAAHLSECQPCLAEHDLDVALKQVVRRSCSGEAAPAAVRMQIMQRITRVQLDTET